MVDFRYHLVSIIAVLLALTMGIVVGTAALSGPIQDGLNDDISRLTADKQALQSEVSSLREQVGAADELAAVLGPQVLRGALDGQRVLLVTTPQTPVELPEQLTPLLTRAGAQVTGTLEVQPALSDTTNAPLVEDLVAQVVPAGVELPDGEPVDRAAAELAAVLAGGGGAAAVEQQEAQAVLAAFTEAELVRFEGEGEGEALRPATLAVLLTGPAPAGSDDVQEREHAALVSLAAELDRRSSGAVLAGPTGSAGQSGPVAALRSASTVADAVSTVDNADRGTGQVAVVLSLAQQLAGRAGQYGAGTGASAALPSPAAS